MSKYGPNFHIKTIPNTIYFARRWYKAPEQLLRIGNYTTAIDVWSIGCIFAEMILRKPLFPGKTNFEQLAMIQNTID